MCFESTMEENPAGIIGEGETCWECPGLAFLCFLLHLKISWLIERWLWICWRIFLDFEISHFGLGQKLIEVDKMLTILMDYPHILLDWLQGHTPSHPPSFDTGYFCHSFILESYLWSAVSPFLYHWRRTQEDLGWTGNRMRGIWCLLRGKTYG